LSCDTVVANDLYILLFVCDFK